MKTQLYVVLMGFSMLASGQSSWFDSFSDHDFSKNPLWEGDTSLFMHNASNQLQLNDSTSGSRSIYTRSTAEHHAIWEGFIEMQFNPSSSNYCSLFLCKDTLGNAIEVRFGGSTEDKISLIRHTSLSATFLTESALDYLDQNHILLNWKVERDSTSQWILSSQLNSDPWVMHGTASDTLHFASTYFEIYARFTSTRADKFVWDDFQVNGNAFKDSIPPYIKQHRWLNRHSIELEWNEAVTVPESISDQSGNYWTCLPSTPQHTTLVSSTRASDGLFHWDLNKIEDLAGNIASDYYAELTRPHFRDLLMAEIQYAPNENSPWKAEYIELFNSTGNPISITNWTLNIQGKNYSLPDLTIGNRALFTNDSIGLGVSAIELNFSSLPNQGGTLEIRDDWGELIEHISYSPNMHSKNWKGESGWALERNEWLPLCENQSAWGSASENGGSPGNVNKPEISPYSPLNSMESILQTDSGFILHFAYPIDTMIAPIAFYAHPNRQMWLVKDSGEINIEPYFCGGFENDTFYTYLETPKTPNNIWITEILVDPKNGDPEFIELYNGDEHTIDLNNIQIGKWSIENGVSSVRSIRSNSYLLPPHTCAVLTYEPQSLFSRFKHSNRRSFVAQGMLPTLPSESGLCLLYSNQLLDSVEWSEESYHPLTDFTRSVSLKRIHRHAEYSSWTSTTSGEGYATPGIFQNEISIEKEEPNLARAQFSPNQDGIYDALCIHFPKSWSGRKCLLRIRSEDGIELGIPIADFLVGEGDILYWDGTNGKSQLLPPGQYLLELESIDTSGNVAFWHHGCLLSSE